jgi:thymidylate synthase (FAD)
MKLIKPGYQILGTVYAPDILRAIELAGRTAYKSEDAITESSAGPFIEMLIRKGHESVLEHDKITIKFICDRGVSHELIRHRIASFTQESTRYCNYSKEKFDGQIIFIIPPWVEEPWDLLMTHTTRHHSREISLQTMVWLDALKNAEQSYQILIGDGQTPQQARSVLPNSLKTEIIVTANIREWRLIMKQRTSAAAHPQMQELMRPVLRELQSTLWSLFGDIEYEKGKGEVAHPPV